MAGLQHLRIIRGSASFTFDPCYQHRSQDRRENHDHPIGKRPAQKGEVLY